MGKLGLFLGVCVLVVGLAVGCGDGAVITQSHNRFGLLLHQQLIENRDGADDNVFISPTSIALALSMAYNGAAGQTAEAFRDVLQWGDLSLAEVNALHQNLIDRLVSSQSESSDTSVDDTKNVPGDVMLNIANAIWYARNVGVNEAFIERNVEFYRAHVDRLDFTASDSSVIVNDWVSEQTSGLIANLVEDLPADLVMLLVNTVYFHGDWSTPFDPNLTRDGIFRLASGTERVVPMMMRTGRIDHYAEPGFQAVRLPYGETGRMAMYVFLPVEGMDPAAVSSRLVDVDWDELIQRFTPKHGEVKLPRFTMEYKTSLKKALQSLGLDVAFDSGRADLSGMKADAMQPNLYVGDVIHQSVLVVDEEGTEAAAATSVTIQPTSLPVLEFRFHADRPFFLAIRDDDTGALLFVGSVMGPTAEIENRA